MKNLLLADSVPVPRPQTSEDNRRQYRQAPETQEPLMKAVDHLAWIGLDAAGDEEYGR